MNPNLFVIRATLCAALITAAASSAAADTASTFPVKPVRWVVPYPAGGSIDVVARIIANRLYVSWGHQIVIDNRLGAGGRLGTQAVINAAPDGYMQLMTLNTNYTLDRSLFKNLGYDPEKALLPITIVASTPQLLVSNPSFPAKNIKELIALAKARPGDINFGSSGAGGSLHLAMELFKSMTGTSMNHIAYKGGVIGVTDVISGQIEIMFLNAPAAAPLIKSGKIRALGISTEKRSAQLPNVPTIAEGGVPGFNIDVWYGLSVPAGTSPAIISKTWQDVTRVLGMPDVRRQLSDIGADPVSINSEDTAKRIHTETATWAKVVQGSSIRFE